MVGSPGAGKTLLARALPGILPEMSIEESFDVTRIFSVADQLLPGTPLIKNRSFWSPHHTISHAGLVGGGNIPKPGEISLTHRGVLFLDEFPEFGTRVLEVMRQPMEDKVVTISRAKGSLTFPANFQLIAAMNPCPCGYYGDSLKPCTCAPAIVTKYQKRISDLMLDRIDIHIEVPRVDYEKFTVFIRRHFKLKIKEAGLPMESRLHDLRHSHISWHIRSGIDIKSVQVIAGHAQASSTLEMYSHLLLGYNREAADKIESIFKVTE